MEKVKKTNRTFSMRDDIYDRLKKYCDESGIWNMSTFVDVAVEEKLKKESDK